LATFTPKQLFQVQPGTSYASGGYTVPAATSTIVKEIVVCNTTGAAVNFTMSFVASGGTASAANNVVSQEAIPAYSTVIYTFSQILATGGFISMLASAAAALTVTAAGVEFA
jgi:hypothetical protein